MDAPSWHAVFAIPELRSHVAVFLKNKHILNLIQTCRHWNDIWYPELFMTVDLHAAPSPYFAKKLGIYGPHIRSLRLKYGVSEKNCDWLIRLVPNLRSLDLQIALMSEPVLEAIVLAVPDLRHVGIRVGKSKIDNMSRTFVHLARLPHLQSLLWSNKYSNYIFADDVLHVLRSCPQLTSLDLRRIHIADLEPGLTPEMNYPQGNRPAQRPTFPIAATDTEGLQAGRRLRKFRLADLSIVSDAALLRILGTDASEDFVAQRRPLVAFALDLDDLNTVTGKSVSRIMSECHALRIFRLVYSQVLLMKIFRESQPWPFAKTLQELVLRNNYPGVQGRVMPMSDQALIKARLNSFTNIKFLNFCGYPIRFAAIEDVKLAPTLQISNITVVVKVPRGTQRSQILAIGDRWLQKQLPMRWDCQVEHGEQFYHYHLHYDYECDPESDVTRLMDEMEGLGTWLH